MNKEETSVFSNGLLWFGAAISIAEMLSGTYFAPLGFTKGLLAIVVGHIIGGALMLFAGLIGAKTKKTAMETVQMSFGSKGSILFSSMNVLQLVGWTGVMIIAGAQACQLIMPVSMVFWSIVIGVLVAVWILVGLTNLGKLNFLAMIGLLAAGLYFTFLIFQQPAMTVPKGDISFGAAVELAVAMPLSWLPLISDYTSTAEKKRKTTFASVITYNLTSIWMYIIGMAGVLMTGYAGIPEMMKSFKLGSIALIIIIFSTITTTFLDVYSAGVSAQTMWKKIDAKKAGIIVCILGTLLAIFAPITKYENFLYLIGSVFVPMIAIQIIDFFFFHKDVSKQNYAKGNLILWLIGFVIARVFINIETPIGSTLPVILIVSVLSVLLNVLRREKDAAKIS